jgi:hypothetical protein
MHRRGLQLHPGGLLALALAGMALACSGEGGEGALTFTLDQPAGKLDPLLDPRLARLALYDDATGDTFGVIPFRVDERLELAAIAAGTHDFRLEGLSSSGQLLSVARAFDVVVSQSAAAQATLHLRKPLAYLAADSRILAFDTAATPGSNEVIDPILLGGATGLAATRAGDLLLATIDEGGGSAVVWLDTGSHTEGGRLPLVAHATGVLVDPRDRYAAILHRADEMISILDLARLRTGAGDAALSTIDAPSPVRATFDANGGLWVVSTNTTRCDVPQANPGVLLHLDVRGAPVNGEAPIALPAITGDVAVHPLNGHPVLALPCQNLVAELAPEGAIQLAGVQKVSDIVIDGTTLFAVGPVPGGADAGQVVTLDLATGLTREVRFPIEPMPIRTGATDAHLNPYYIDVPATALQAADLVVSPRGARAAFIHQITYYMVTDIQYRCSNLVINIVEHGYSIVDLEAAQLISTTPTDYEVDCVCDGQPQGNCISGTVDPAAYRPKATTILMGVE